MVFRKTLISGFLVLAIVCSPLASLADEGMWLPGALDKLPQEQLKKRGLQLRPDEIYSRTKASLKDAIVRISSGGTGSFVSPEGLILTNHHVSFAAVTRASTTEKDYINQGFLATARAEEIPARGYTISILQDYEDVTNAVLSATRPEMSPDERQIALEAKRQELAKMALNGREKEGIQTQIVEATSGLQYFLYTYLTLRDIRLVYAPPKSIGYFGGDPDNFEWPRHCGDFAFLRAYVGADGKPADFSKDNVPFKPKKFLPLSATGLKEGDFTMVLGHPGATYRYRESYSIDFRQNIQLPSQIGILRRQIATLTRLGERKPAQKMRLADQVFTLSNSLKALEGAVVGLRKMNLVERKRADEESLRKWLETNPDAKARHSDVLPQIEALYKDLRSFSEEQDALNEVLSSGDLVSALLYAYNRALDKEKPVQERGPQFSDAVLAQITAQLAEGWEDRENDAEAELLASGLARIADLPANQKFRYVETLFGSKTGDERRSAERTFAQQAFANSKFRSLDELKKLLAASAAEVRATDDPLLKLVIAVADENAPLARRQARFGTEITRLRPKYITAMMEMKKSPYYPDANFTLRFSYGEIKGYKPRDAVTYDWQTSLGGVIEKDTGIDPFNVPDKLKTLYAGKDFGGYIDGRLNDVPVAFITDNDITGGNSGSPVLNGRGEIIGLVFDGNYEGLGNDYAFDDRLVRCLAVDIRYVLFITDKLANASYLFNEMTIKRGKVMTAKG